MLSNYLQDKVSLDINDFLYDIHRGISSGSLEAFFMGLTLDDFKFSITNFTSIYILDYTYNLFDSVVQDNGIYRISLFEGFNDELFNEKLNNIIEKLQGLIPNNASDYEVAKIIYDYIGENFKYNLKLFKKIKRLENDFMEQNKLARANPSDFCIYGPVVKGEGVCSGLSHLYVYLLKQFGVEAMVVTGRFKEKGKLLNINHAVVLVEIDGKRAYVDIVTAIKDVNPIKRILYDYFLVSSYRIRNIIEPFSQYNLEDFDNKISYYELNNINLKTVDEVRSFLEKTIVTDTEKRIYFSYTGKGLTKSKLEDLVNEIVGKKKGRKFTYDFINNDGYISLVIYKGGSRL